MFLLLVENDFFWKFIFLRCWFAWLLISLTRIWDFILLSLKILVQAYELDSSFKVSWKPRPHLMEGDLWLLKIISKILVLSWNPKWLSFYYNFPFSVLTSNYILQYFSSFPWYCSLIPSSTFLPSSNFSCNLIISFFSPFYCSSNTWSNSSFFLFEFSRSSLRETILASSPSQYCLDYTTTRSLLSYVCSLSLRLIILFKARLSLLIISITSSNLSSFESITP